MPDPTFQTAGTLRGALIGGVASGALNIGVFFAFGAAGAAFLIQQPGSPPMPVQAFMPMVNSVMAALVGTAILLGVQKLAPARAWRIFLGVSALVFLAFGALPPMVLGDDTLGIAALEAMHVVTAAGVLGGMRKWGLAS